MMGECCGCERHGVRDVNVTDLARLRHGVRDTGSLYMVICCSCIIIPSRAAPELGR